MRKLPKYVSAFFDRHGKERFAYRRAGVKVSLPGPFNSPAFREALEAAKGALPKIKPPRHAPGTVDELLSLYYQGTVFQKMSDTRKRIARGILELFRDEFGGDMVANFEFDHIEAILLTKSKKRKVGKRTVGGPEAARSLHEQLKRVFKYAVKKKLIRHNPAEEADGAGGDIGTRHTWTEEQIAQYCRHWPLGTKPRLALEIILWTAQRRADASLFGPEHTKTGKVVFTAGKGDKAMILPLAPQLKRAIAAMPSVGIKTYLVTAFGKPFSKEGFGNWFREQCIAAGLPDECRAHGLRKAITRRAAGLEATQQQLKAIGGWEQDAEVTTYTKGVDQAKLADAAIGRIIAWDEARTKGEE